MPLFQAIIAKLGSSVVGKFVLQWVLNNFLSKFLGKLLEWILNQIFRPTKKAVVKTASVTKKAVVAVKNKMFRPRDDKLTK